MKVRNIYVSKVILSLVVALSCASLGAASFVTPAMIKRNGLTDEQYEALWKQGKNPQIDIASARDWIFRAGRYQNVTNWLDICGKTNNFAALSYDLQGKNFILSETNRYLKAVNVYLYDKVISLSNSVETLYVSLTNQIAMTQSAERAKQLADEAKVIAEQQRDAANDKLATIKSQIQSKRDEYQEKYDKGTVITKPIYKAIIAVFDALLKLFD